MSELKKKKILWVVYCFVQAGGERYVYEICKALNKNKYEVDVLHVTPLGTEKEWASEYYYQLILDSGCHIIDLHELLEKNKIPKKTLLQKGFRFIKKKIRMSVRQYLPTSQYILKFLNEYDYVNFAGNEVYKTLCISRNITPGNALIHILTAQFQTAKDLFEGFNKSLKYHFVSSIPEKSQHKDLQNFDNYQLTYFPLCLETKSYNINPVHKEKDYFKVAVFTRLSPMKPLDPYFYALKLLIEENVNVVLDIYGAGNPEELGMIRQLKYLYIRDYVFFKGHTDSIGEVLKKGDIDLIWFQSNDSMPAGYAALEISMSGIPQIFWDFAKIEDNNTLQEIFPSFTSLLKFVNFTRQLMSSEKLRKQIGHIQREYVMAKNSSDSQIKILEEIYDV